LDSKLSAAALREGRLQCGVVGQAHRVSALLWRPMLQQQRGACPARAAAEAAARPPSQIARQVGWTGPLAAKTGRTRIGPF
jgi:hypothetical protein